jgi:hypothetical protein
MASGSFSGAYRGYTLRTDWSSTHNVAGNYSTITCNHYLILAQYYSLYIDGRTNYCTVNGETKSFWSSAISAGSATTIHLGTTTYTVYHNSDGKKSVDASTTFYMKATISGTYVDSITASGTMILDNIPRYATSNQSLNSKTETTIKMNWSSDSTIDYIWYSTDWGTTWKAVGSVNATSGTYTISTQSKNTSILNANTTYNIITRVRRKDSQLTTDSSKLSVTTYDYPKPTSLAHFTIGDGVVVNVENPLGRWYRLELISKETWAVIASQEGTYSGGVTIGKSENEINLQYMSIPNKQVGGYYARVLYENNERTLDLNGTYKIRGNEAPTVGSISYKDSNSTTTAITGNNQRIIRNNSNLLFTVGTATAKNYASISKYEVVFNEINKSRATIGDLDFGKVNISNNLNATLIVTDSRGLTASKEITVIIDDWILPTAITTLQRKNNFYSETYIKVDGSISYLNGKNAITIQCQYKKVDDSSYSSLITLNDNIQKTLDLDNNYQWNIRVIVKDKLGSTTYNLVLDRGMPLIFFDKFLSSVGVNCFPSGRNNLYTNELPVSGTTFAQMFTKGEKSFASGSLILVDAWKTDGNVMNGKFYCDPTNKRMVIPAGTCEYIEVSGNIAGYGSVYGYLSISDSSSGVDSIPFLIPINNYFSTPIASRIIKIPDIKKDYYVKLELQGYNGTTFVMNNGFGDGATYISVKKIL